MGDAPDKPDPHGLIQLSNSLLHDNTGGTIAWATRLPMCKPW